ncbi:hypothetical protein BH10BAC3_BH10BAC3_07940 [soil metagenome]
MRLKHFFLILIMLHVFGLSAQKIDSLQKIKAHYQNKISVLNDSIKSIDHEINILISINQNQINGTKTILKTTTKEGAPIKELPDIIAKNIRFAKKDDSLTIDLFLRGTYGDYYVKLQEGGYLKIAYINMTDQLIGLEKMFRAEDEKRTLDEKALNDQSSKSYQNSILKKFGTTNGGKILKKQIWIGMTVEMTTYSWGTPDEINRTVYSFGIHEQWIYNGSKTTYLYFEDTILKSWQD